MKKTNILFFSAITFLWSYNAVADVSQKTVCTKCNYKHSYSRAAYAITDKDEIAGLFYKKRVDVQIKVSSDLDDFPVDLMCSLNRSFFDDISKKGNITFLPTVHNLDFGQDIVASDLPFGFARIVDAKLKLVCDYTVIFNFQKETDESELPTMLCHAEVIDQSKKLVFCDRDRKFISKDKDGMIYWTGSWRGISGYIEGWFHYIPFQYASSAAVIKRADFQSYKDWKNAVEEHYSANYWKKSPKSPALYEFLCPLCNVDKCQGDCSKQQAVFAEQIKKINTKNMQK